MSICEALPLCARTCRGDASTDGRPTGLRGGLLPAPVAATRLSPGPGTEQRAPAAGARAARTWREPAPWASAGGDAVLLVTAPGESASVALPRVLVVGTGLIGTSVALALRQRGSDVVLQDVDPRSARTAVQRGAGREWTPDDALLAFTHVVLAVPPGAVAAELARWQGLLLATTFSDVASVKAQPLFDAERVGCDLSSFVGGHPFAGRERGGPESADAELFLGRSWALCPTPRSSSAALEAAVALVLACGARPLVTNAQRHDSAAAALSHVPQLVASAVAASSRSVDSPDLRLAGQGFLDTTRIADSDPRLWSEVVAANAEPVRAGLQRVVDELQTVLEALTGGRQLETSSSDALTSSSDAETSSSDVLTSATDVTGIASRPTAGGSEALQGVTAVERATFALLMAGNEGRRRLPDKTSERRERWARVTVVVPDQPGELARLLLAAAGAGVNVEDLRVEHTPGGSGLADLDVLGRFGAALVVALRRDGWRCHLEDPS